MSSAHNISVPGAPGAAASHPDKAAGVSPARRTSRRWLARIEFVWTYLAGSLLGIQYVVRYLRNPNPDVTVRLLRAFGASVGADTTIKGALLLDNVQGNANSTGDLSHLSIGRNCYIGESVFFDLAAEIVIEDAAVLAGRVSLLTHAECNRSEYLSQVFPRQTAAVRIGSGAWIGFGATILHGVAIGSNTAIGAASVVIRSTGTESVYAGVPARVLRRLP